MTRPIAALLTACLLLGPVGCAHRAVVPPIAAPEPKPDAGMVGLAVAPGPYQAYFQQPGAAGASEGAKYGAKRGAGGTVTAGLAALAVGASGRNGYAAIGGLMMFGASIVVAPVAAAIGATVGALAVPSRENVERNKAALERAFDDAKLPDAFQGWILEAGTSRPIGSVTDPAVPVVDTFLELDELAVTLTSKDPTAWTPDLRLRLSVHGRLVSAADGEELREWSWEEEGPEATFAEWGKDDARKFRAELERGGRALAAKIIADLY